VDGVAVPTLPERLVAEGQVIHRAVDQRFLHFRRLLARFAVSFAITPRLGDDQAFATGFPFPVDDGRSVVSRAVVDHRRVIDGGGRPVRGVVRVVRRIRVRIVRAVRRRIAARVPPEAPTVAEPGEAPTERPAIRAGTVSPVRAVVGPRPTKRNGPVREGRVVTVRSARRIPEPARVHAAREAQAHADRNLRGGIGHLRNGTTGILDRLRAPRSVATQAVEAIEALALATRGFDAPTRGRGSEFLTRGARAIVELRRRLSDARRASSPRQVVVHRSPLRQHEVGVCATAVALQDRFMRDFRTRQTHQAFAGGRAGGARRRTEFRSATRARGKSRARRTGHDNLRA